jgi:ribonuclease HII
MDEVGRGAWAGPLLVGVVLVDADVGPAPTGTRDSKLLARSAREELLPSLQAWCRAWSVGQASAREIDELGLTAALGLAANRAMAALPTAPDALIVDGPYDFVSGRSAEADDRGAPRITTRVGADAACSSVAAASVIAKVLRDRRMLELSAVHPGYGFDAHVGYGTTAHASAIAERGLCAEHRRTWSFATTGADEQASEAIATVACGAPVRTPQLWSGADVL